MKILIIVMGILSLFSSCTGRKVKLAEEDKSVQNRYEVKENKSCLDHDTLLLILAASTRVMILLKCIIKNLMLKLLIGIIMILMMVFLLQDYPMVL